MFGTQKGTVTLIALVVVITMLGISGAMFFSSNSYSLMVHEQKMTTRVFYLAETGISHGILALNNMKYPNFNSALLGPDGVANTPDDGMIGETGMISNGLDGTTEHGPGTKLFGGGFYRVRVFDNEDGDLNPMADSDGIIILQSIGNLGLRHKKIEIFLQADLRLQSPFSKGPLTGDEEVRVGQDSFVSAINSNLPLPILDQIASSLFTSDGNINSNGSLEIDKNSTIQGNVTSTASVETGDIEIDQNTTILGNIFTDNGDINIGSGSTISGSVATNDGEVDGFPTPSPEGSAQIPPNPFPEYQEQYDQLLAEENGGSVSEVPSPTTPSKSGVPGANIFSNVTYSGGSRTLGVAGTSKTYYFDSLSMKSGALLNLVGDVTIIVKDKFDINNPDTRIISTGNVTFIVGEYEQHNGTSLQVTGNFNLQASNSDEGDIRIDGTTTITGSASIIAEDKMEFASKSVLSIGGDATLAAKEDEVRLSGSATFNGNTTIDAGEGVRFKADSSGQGAEGTYTFNGNLTVDALNDIKIENKTTLALNGTENYFFAEDNVEVKHGATLLNLDPSRFFIYAWGEDPDVIINLDEDSGPIGVAVFAPNGDVEVGTSGSSDNDTVIGALVGRTIRTAKGSKIFYDKNLDDFGPTTPVFFGYTVVAYKSY